MTLLMLGVLAGLCGHISAASLASVDASQCGYATSSCKCYRTRPNWTVTYHVSSQQQCDDMQAAIQDYADPAAFCDYILPLRRSLPCCARDIP
ncbi:hypothetical protein B7486_01995 [cyanobacterium TDX16]|nr:hypothetical protein B7486_01995 [cyanobacterium TDX16]